MATMLSAGIETIRRGLEEIAAIGLQLPASERWRLWLSERVACVFVGRGERVPGWVAFFRLCEYIASVEDEAEALAKAAPRSRW